MPEAEAGELDAEDAKLVTLARGARVRVRALEGAAVRDDTGRSYSAATVELPSLRISALRLAVATAAASGARGLEAAVVLGDRPALDEADISAVRDLGGPDVALILATADGSVRARNTADAAGRAQ
jgi:hypothetical protein